jgi:uncharacterized protein YjbI with pentapeptide repeats
MANQEQLNLLKAGVEGWNAWRQANAEAEMDVVIDLSGADLTGANLHGADLMYADLRGADLRGTDLNGADFTNADLSGANFTDVNVRFAILDGANTDGIINTDGVIH